MTNQHPDTGIRYGYISARSLDPDLVHTLMYEVGTDLTYAEAVREVRLMVENEADLLEEACAEALRERDFHITEDPMYETLLETEIESAYLRCGYSDREDYIDVRVDRTSEHIYVEEAIVEGEYAGVKYRTSWLGGALNFWIFESPRAGLYQECSPCVPNAGNLDCPDNDGVLTYDVDPDWRWVFVP
jgi:hypothetical protein